MAGLKPLLTVCSPGPQLVENGDVHFVVTAAFFPIGKDPTPDLAHPTATPTLLSKGLGEDSLYKRYYFTRAQKKCDLQTTLKCS